MTLELKKDINYGFSIGKLLEIEDKVCYYDGSDIILKVDTGEIIFNFKDYTYHINGFCYSFDPENISFDLLLIEFKNIISIKIPKKLEYIFKKSIEKEKIEKISYQRGRIKTGLKYILEDYNN